MALDDGFDDRQTKATTGCVPRARRIRLVEPIEYVRQMLRRDARSGIAHRHDDAHRPRTRRSAPPCPPFGVWRSAFAARFCSACSSRIGSPATISAPGAMLVVSSTPFCSAARPWRASTRPNRSSSGTSCASNDSPPPSSRDKIEQIADDVLDALRLVSNDGEIPLARLGVERLRVKRERFEITAHAGQRRHQLVRDVCQQQPPGAIGGLQLLRALLEIVRHLIERAWRAPRLRRRRPRARAPSDRRRLPCARHPRGCAAADAPDRRSATPPTVVPMQRRARRRQLASVGPSCRSAERGIAITTPTGTPSTMMTPCRARAAKWRLTEPRPNVALRPHRPWTADASTRRAPARMNDSGSAFSRARTSMHERVGGHRSVASRTTRPSFMMATSGTRPSYS